MSDLKEIGKNSLFIYIARVSDAILGLATMSTVAHYLSIREFGMYMLVLTVGWIIAPFLNLGVEHILVREISRTRERASDLFVNGIAINCILFLICAIAFILLAQFLKLERVVMIALCLNFLSEAFKTFMRIIISVFLAFEKMAYDAFLTFFSKAATLVLTIGIIYMRLDFVSIFAVCLIGNLLGFLISALILCKAFFKPTLSISADQLRYIFVESFPIGINKISQQIYFYIGVFVLKILGDDVAIALFQGPNKLIISLQIIPVAVMTALQPLMSRLGGSGLNSNFEFLYRKSFKVLFILSLPLATLGAVLSGKIVPIIFGEALKEGTVSLQILFWAVIFIFLDTLMTVVLTSIDRQRLLIIGNVICIITNLAASLLLVKGYGYVGAAWAALLSYLVLFFTDFYFVTRYLKTAPTSEGMVQALVGCLIAGSILHLLLGLHIILLLLVGALVYFGTVVALKAFSSEEIQIFKKAVGSRA